VRQGKLGRALISVSDKTGVVALARTLADCGAELVSTAGTGKALRDAGLPVINMSRVTGFDALFGGRIKAMHPAIFGGLVARPDRAADREDLAAHKLTVIDVLVIGIGPFEPSGGGAFDDGLELIDLGGPALIRAAAKNPDNVIVLTDPDDYAPVMRRLAGGDGVGVDLRRRLAARALRRTALHDAALASWYASQAGEPCPNCLTRAARQYGTSRRPMR
jgi:phosphoribosylaminoimidazolecarboxamide formyltransferase/IMP cyclohydrolase